MDYRNIETGWVGAFNKGRIRGTCLVRLPGGRLLMKWTVDQETRVLWKKETDDENVAGDIIAIDSLLHDPAAH